MMSFYKKGEKEDLGNSGPDLGGWEGHGADHPECFADKCAREQPRGRGGASWALSQGREVG